MAKLFESIGKLGLALAVGGGVVNSALFNGEWSNVQRKWIVLNSLEFSKMKTNILYPNRTMKLFHNWWMCLVTVDAGHRAVIFDRFRGVQDAVVGEGTHFLIPWVQKPIIFDCRSRPRNVPVITGSKGTSVVSWGVVIQPSTSPLHLQTYECSSLQTDSLYKPFTPTDLQNVNITLRILFRPVTTQLPRIFTSIGEDYDERVLPSITTEVLKAVVVGINYIDEIVKDGPC